MSRRSVALTPRVAAALRSISARRAPRESGGLLIGSGPPRRRLRISGYVELPNVDPRDNRYAADPALVRRWLRTTPAGGAEVLGFFHSHPEGLATPSRSDRTTMGAGQLHLLVGALGELRVYSRDAPDEPLVESPVSDGSSPERRTG